VESVALRLHRLRGALQILGEPLTRSGRQLSGLRRGIANLFAGRVVVAARDLLGRRPGHRVVGERGRQCLQIPPGLR
jgi:hypothetical protein